MRKTPPRSRRARKAAARPPPIDRGQIAKGRAAGGAPRAATRLERARELFREKRYGEALKEYGRAAKAEEGAAGAAPGMPAKGAAAVRDEVERCRLKVEEIKSQLEEISRRRRGSGAGGADAGALGYRTAVCEYRLGRYREALKTLDAGGGGGEGGEKAAGAAGGGGAVAGYKASMLSGDCLHALGQRNEAEYAYLYALDDDAIPAGKCVQIGDMLKGSGRYAGAESAYARAEERGADVRLKREHCKARIGTADLPPDEPLPEGRAERAGIGDRIMKEARRLDKEGRYDDAARMYIKAFRADPRMPDGFAEKMERLFKKGGGGGGGGGPPHNADKIPAGSLFVVDSNVCLKAVIMRALGKKRSKDVPREWGRMSGIAASFEKNVKAGAYALLSRTYHETRSLLYSTRGIEGLGMSRSEAVDICKEAAGRLDRLWKTHGTKARPAEKHLAEAGRGMWAGWIAADRHTKADWRSRKDVPKRPYEGGRPGEWADTEILASAIMILRGSGGGKDGDPPKSVALLTRDSDFTMFAGTIADETGVQIVSKFA